MPKLSVKQIQSAKYPPNRKGGSYLLADGNGLYLQITPAGTKSWIFRFQLNGKGQYMGLGSVLSGDKTGLSLADARLKAAEAKALVRRGINPKDHRDNERQKAVLDLRQNTIEQITFQTVARDYISAQSMGWSNPKHRKQWPSTLETYVFPLIGDRPIGKLEADDIEAILKPIWTKVPETASRVRGRLEKIFDYAASRGFREGNNPASWKGCLAHRLPPISRIKRTRHHPALPWKFVPSFVRELRENESVSAAALLFCILNASRSAEVRSATWSEIDFDNRIWTIPAERMKAGREHRVPLSLQSIEVLTQVDKLKRGRGSIIFPSRKGSGSIALSDMALSQLIRGMNETENGFPKKWIDSSGRSVVPHGFRSSFRDWCEEATTTPHAVSEAALAHVVANKVEAAYRRTDLFDKRRILMADWGAYCWSGSETQIE